MLREIKALLIKELLLEWRQRYALNGLLLYVLSMAVVLALTFLGGVEIPALRGEALLSASAQTWNALYWLLMFFVAINAIAKSFIGEQEGHLYYLYGIASPTAVLLAKMLYSTLLLTLIGAVAFLAHAGLGGVSLAHPGLFALSIPLGAFAFSANLSLVSAISSKAENKNTLLAVLSFPLMVPLLLNLMRLSAQALAPATPDPGNAIMFIGGVSVSLAALSVLLFPYIWRE